MLYIIDSFKYAAIDVKRLGGWALQISVSLALSLWVGIWVWTLPLVISYMDNLLLIIEQFVSLKNRLKWASWICFKLDLAFEHFSYWVLENETFDFFFKSTKEEGKGVQKIA